MTSMTSMTSALCPQLYEILARTSKLGTSKLGTSMTSMTSALCPQLYEILARTSKLGTSKLGTSMTSMTSALCPQLYEILARTSKLGTSKLGTSMTSMTSALCPQLYEILARTSKLGTSKLGTSMTSMTSALCPQLYEILARTSKLGTSKLGTSMTSMTSALCPQLYEILARTSKLGTSKLGTSMTSMTSALCPQLYEILARTSKLGTSKLGTSMTSMTSALCPQLYEILARTSKLGTSKLGTSMTSMTSALCPQLYEILARTSKLGTSKLGTSMTSMTSALCPQLYEILARTSKLGTSKLGTSMTSMTSALCPQLYEILARTSKLGTSKLGTSMTSMTSALCPQLYEILARTSKLGTSKLGTSMTSMTSALCPQLYEILARTSKLGTSKLGTSMTSMTSALCPQLYEILARTPYGDVTRGEVGVDRLLSEEVFSAAYPLHEGSYEVPRGVTSDRLSVRQVLFQYWARWGSWYRYQPLDHIRDYFGEKVALYFAWLGFYTGWLVPAAVMGTVVFLFGFWLVTTDLPAKELCHSDIIMCPLCNICSHWNLSSICLTFKAGLLFDNGGTVFFSVFMALWSVTFLEFWKRSCSCLTHRWNCSQYQEMEERPRPEFTAMAPMTTRNPVTGAEEPYFPETQRLRRILTGGTVIVVMVFMVLMFLIAIILYRTIVSIVIYRAQKSFVVLSASRIASLTGSLLNLLVIMTLSRIYISLAYILTRWEMHRTQSKYEDMFILKVFIFQFVNFYSSPVYITFFKGRFIGYPGNYNELFGIRNEDCGPGGCLIELAQELLVIMVGKQLINNIQEFLSPKLKGWWQARKGEEGGGQKEPPLPWETDYQLLVCEGLFSEYLEMVLQFGFITIFVAACPLAPLFALFNNWLEVRLDAHKFVCLPAGLQLLLRTPAPLPLDPRRQPRRLRQLHPLLRPSQRHQPIKPRLQVSRLQRSDGELPARVLPAVGSEAGLRHHLRSKFTFIHHQAWRHVIKEQHVVFLSGHVIDLMVPDVPEEVETKIKREFYMAKEALAEHQSADRTLIPGQMELGGVRQRVTDAVLQGTLVNLLQSYSDPSQDTST
ncbi:anoctamin-7 isoform X3 [Gadus morhua]|uniref:anoctamin-7 isoform X3 n=1 Tax=Gadus morhua TaxID=8049 RepID=UPI0011B44466|nr:anoctamin-7 isoform X3 [Gadus morhua]